MAAISTNGRNPKTSPLRGFGTMFIIRRMADPSVCSRARLVHFRLGDPPVSLPGLTLQSSIYGRRLPDRPVKPGDERRFGPIPLQYVLELAVRGELHVCGIEPQLDVLLGAEIAGRHGDADRILRFDMLTEQVVLEAKRAHEVHDLRQLGAGREGQGVLGGVEHPCCFQLRLEAGEVGSGSLRHRFAGGPPPIALVLQERNGFIPDADQRLAEIGLSLSVSVLIPIKSCISPGILLESNTSVAFGSALTSMSWGFHVTTAIESGDLNAATISASDVLTVLISFSLRRMLVSPLASK